VFDYQEFIYKEDTFASIKEVKLGMEVVLSYWWQWFIPRDPEAEGTKSFRCATSKAVMSDLCPGGNVATTSRTQGRMIVCWHFGNTSHLRSDCQQRSGEEDSGNK
jgi:hypothetical protein